MRSSLVLLLGLAACNGDATDTDTRPDPDVDTTPLEDLDPNGDEDDDGLTNGEELQGIAISVNSSGWVGAVESIEATSSPYRADTDGDGLTDLEERTTRTHPSFADTDGDGLDDWEEARFWATSPVNVDTAGDATGPGPTARPPNPALFDGAELQLRRDVGDMDVPGIPGSFATSPLSADTDGDNLDDYSELVLPNRSPSIAEAAEVELIITPNSEFYLALHATYEDGTTDTQSFSSSWSVSDAFSTEVSTEASAWVTASLDTWVTVTASASVGCCIDIFEAEADIAGGFEASLETGMSTTMGFNATTSHESSDTVARASEAVATSSVELTGGGMGLSLDLLNTGNITTRVADIAVIVRFNDPEGSGRRVLGELVPQSGSGALLAPGESVTLQLRNDDLPLDPVRTVMESPSSVQFELARYDLRDQADTDLDFVYQHIPERTASVTFERNGLVERFQVAADIFTDADGTRYGTTLADALTQFGMGFAILTNDEGEPAVSIDGIVNELHTTPAPDLQANGGDPYGYPITGGPNARTMRRGWVGIMAARDEDDRGAVYPDLFSTRLKPGDSITLVLGEDLDQDGIPNIEEAMWGSSDFLIHSDSQPGLEQGDGLSDYFEIREGWLAAPQQFVPYRTYSSPAMLDTDGDGLWDNEEVPFDNGPATDPTLQDTDGDGFSDGVEVLNVVGLLDPLRPDARTQPNVDCTFTSSRYTCERTYTVHVTDEAGDVVDVLLDLEDGVPDVWLTGNWSAGTPYDEELEHLYCFTGHYYEGSGIVHVTDSTGDLDSAYCEFAGEVL